MKTLSRERFKSICATYVCVILCFGFVVSGILTVVTSCKQEPAKVISGILHVSAAACEAFVDDSGTFPDWVQIVCKDIETDATFTMRMPRKQWLAMKASSHDGGL